jgi:anti-sigma regulatory factor (Ser/Thr protein kinase)
LNIIVGYTDLLLEGAFPSEAEQLDAMSRIHQQSRQLLDLIQSMLDLNRMEAGGISLVFEEFPIAAALDSLRNGLPTAWCRPGVALRWEAQDTAAPMHSDRGKVELILRNLLHNALKYTSHGSVTVRALPDRHRGRVDFSVIDTGDGIAPEDLAGIFDMFRQGTSGPPRGGGVGLGLYLVKRLTDALGGTIAVDSRPGAGSSFTCRCRWSRRTDRTHQSTNDHEEHEELCPSRALRVLCGHWCSFVDGALLGDAMASDLRHLPLLFKPHPWHGIPIGDDAPRTVTCFIEIVPTDTVKYELDKETGYLKVDRPQKFSNICPSLYGFIPQTYCGERVGAFCARAPAARASSATAIRWTSAC